MQTVTVKQAFEQDLWKQDDPVLCFTAPYESHFHHDEHLVLELYQAGEGYLARCCLCGQQFALKADDALTVYAWGQA